MKGRMPWIYLLLTFVLLLLLNMYLTKEGFYNFGDDPFTKYILSLITLDPDDNNHYGRHGDNDLSGCPVPTPPNPPTPPTPTPPNPTPTPPNPNSNALSESTALSLINYLKADIDQSIRNQKICERNEENKKHDDSKPTPTPCTEQGKQSTNCQRMNTSQIDMSEYIRRDSIPCWGCSV